MFNFDFAYSQTMQLLLFVISCATTLYLYILVTNSILLLYSTTATLGRKTVFVLVAGLCLNNLWTYGVYFVGGLLSFSPIVYNLVTVPNPVFALFFVLLGICLFKLSPFRSIRLLGNIYLGIMCVKLLLRFIGFALFPQNGISHNYFSDCVSLLLGSVIHTFLYLAIKRYSQRPDNIIHLADNVQTSPLWMEFSAFFLKTALLYTLTVIYPLYAGKSENLNIFIVFIILLASLS